jgi:hypothetical protein
MHDRAPFTPPAPLGAAPPASVQEPAAFRRGAEGYGIAKRITGPESGLVEPPLH